MKLPAGWEVPSRLLLIVILEIGLRNYAAHSGLGAALLAPSGERTDFPLFVALLLLLFPLTAIWLVLPLAAAGGLMTLWKLGTERLQSRRDSRSSSQLSTDPARDVAPPS